MISHPPPRTLWRLETHELCYHITLSGIRSSIDTGALFRILVSRRKSNILIYVIYFGLKQIKVAFDKRSYIYLIPLFRISYSSSERCELLRRVVQWHIWAFNILLELLHFPPNTGRHPPVTSVTSELSASFLSTSMGRPGHDVHRSKGNVYSIGLGLMNLDLWYKYAFSFLTLWHS